MTSKYNESERKKDLEKAVEMKNHKFETLKHGTVRYTPSHITKICRLPQWRAVELGLVRKPLTERERRIIAQTQEKMAREARLRKNYSGMITMNDEDLKTARQKTVLQRGMQRGK